MKHLLKALALGSALAPLAHATPINANISVAGSDTFTTSSITFNTGFVTSGTVNGNSVTPGTAIMFPTPTITYVPGGTVSPAFQFATLGAYSFYVTSESFIYNPSNNGYSTLELLGNGYFSDGIAADNTAATYDLTSQEVIGTTQASIAKGSFSASGISNAATPEPSSLILLGTGVLGAAGMLRRRFTGKSNA